MSKSLVQFIIEEQRRLEGGAELIALVNDIQTACKYIASAVARGALAGAHGRAGDRVDADLPDDGAGAVFPTDGPVSAQGAVT